MAISFNIQGNGMLPKTKLIIAAVIVVLSLLIVEQMRQAKDDDEVKAMLTENQASSSAQTIQEWKEFQPQSNRFKVLLPALPQHASEVTPLAQNQGLIKYDMYISQEKDGTTYMISMSQYPDNFDIGNTSEFLNRVVKEMVAASSNNKLLSNEMGNFYNNPSVDFSLQNNEVYVRGKMFMVGKTMFGLIVSERSLQNLEEHFTKFANSFVLNEMQPAAHESMQPEQVLPQSLPNSSPQQQ